MIGELGIARTGTNTANTLTYTRYTHRRLRREDGAGRGGEGRASRPGRALSVRWAGRSEAISFCRGCFFSAASVGEKHSPRDRKSAAGLGDPVPHSPKPAAMVDAGASAADVTEGVGEVDLPADDCGAAEDGEGLEALLRRPNISTTSCRWNSPMAVV